MPALCFWLRAKLPQFAQVYEALPWRIFLEILFVREIELVFVIIFDSAEASTKIREYQVMRHARSKYIEVIMNHFCERFIGWNSIQTASEVFQRT